MTVNIAPKTNFSMNSAAPDGDEILTCCRAMRGLAKKQSLPCCDTGGPPWSALLPPTGRTRCARTSQKARDLRGRHLISGCIGSSDVNGAMKSRSLTNRLLPRHALRFEQRIQEQAGALALRSGGDRHSGRVFVAAEVADLALAARYCGAALARAGEALEAPFE